MLFSGSIFIWANFFLSALLRGGGDAATPGRYMLISSIAQVPLSYVLALGIGGWTGMGMAGPAISSLLTSAVSALLQARALWSGKLGFVPAVSGVTLQIRLFWEILRVGLIASFSAFTANLTAMLVTAWSAASAWPPSRATASACGSIHAGAAGLRHRLGPDHHRRCRGRRRRLAPGRAGRLDRQPGRGPRDRRLRLARGAFSGRLGGCSPNDPDVIAATVAYVTRVAPFYFLFGIGMTLSFASQGAGRMKAPFAAGVTRLFVASLGGWFAIEHLGWGLPGVFVAIAVGIVTFGSLIAGPLLVHPWRGRA